MRPARVPQSYRELVSSFQTLMAHSGGDASSSQMGDLDLSQLLADKAALADALSVAKSSKIEWVKVGGLAVVGAVGAGGGGGARGGAGEGVMARGASQSPLGLQLCGGSVVNSI